MGNKNVRNFKFHPDSMFVLIPIEPEEKTDQAKQKYKAIAVSTSKELIFAAARAEADCTLDFIANKKIPGQWIAEDENGKIWVVKSLFFSESWSGKYHVTLLT